MLRFIVVAFVVALLTVLPADAHAQALAGGVNQVATDQVAPVAWTKERIESPPKREIRFERSEEPLKRNLPSRNARLVELKWVASMNVQVPTLSGLNDLQDVADTSTRQLAVFLLYPGTRSPSFPLGEQFRSVVESLPEAERPPQAMLDLFTGEQINGRISLERAPVPPSETPRALAESGRTQATVEILAATPEQADQSAAALLRIIDWGISRPIQLKLLSDRERLLGQLAEVKRRTEEGTRVLGAEAAEVARLEQATDEASSGGLTTLNAQLLVERSGIRARMEACDRMLAGDGLPAARRESVKDQRLTAEIDLASVETRIKALQAVGQLRGSARALRNYQSMEQSAAAYLARFAPPTLVDERVVVQPIQWQ